MIAATILAASLATAGGFAFADSHEAGAMDTMMGAMPMESSGMVDADFILMIPYHQSAIDKARVELEQGEDDATKAMAQEIIDAQEAEIAEMRTMLEGMGVEPPAAPAE